MSDDVPQKDRDQKSGPKHVVYGFIFSTVVLIVLLVRLVFPTVFERFDLIALGLLGIAALPWLSTFIEEFEVAGVFSAKMRAMERRIEEGLEEAKQHAEDTSQNMLLATPTDVQSDAENTSGGLENLAQTYVSTRQSMQSGGERTAQMTAIFHQMMGEARRAGRDGYDAERGLKSDDPGQNLAAVAFAYTFPNHIKVHSLIDCVERSKQPFVQYWGLKAVQKILSSRGISAFAPRDMTALRNLRDVINPKTDRGFLLRRIDSEISGAVN